MLSHIFVYSDGRLSYIHIEPEMLEHFRFTAFGKFEGLFFDFGVELLFSPLVCHYCSSALCSSGSGSLDVSRVKYSFTAVPRRAVCPSLAAGD